MKAYLLSADKWQMKDENTGKETSGYSLWFVAPYRDSTDESRGYKPAKISVSDQLAHAVKNVDLPAVADIDISMRPGAAGKATPVVTGMTIIGSVPLEKIINAVPPPQASR